MIRRRAPVGENTDARLTTETRVEVSMAGLSISKSGRVVKRRHYVSAVVMLVALLAGWFAPLQHSFNQRWVGMPAAMSVQMFNAARKLSSRPSFCMPLKCRVG